MFLSICVYFQQQRTQRPQTGRPDYSICDQLQLSRPPSAFFFHASKSYYQNLLPAGSIPVLLYHFRPILGKVTRGGGGGGISVTAQCVKAHAKLEPLFLFVDRRTNRTYQARAFDLAMTQDSLVIKMWSASYSRGAVKKL